VNQEQVTALEQRAIALARSGEFGSDARSVNEEITRLAPDNQGAWTRLARCCMEMGQLDDATAALDAALQVNPQNTIAHNLQLEVSKRRAGPIEAAAPRKRAASGTRTAATKRPAAAGAAKRSARSTVALGGFGRAEFTALGHLEPAAAVESLTARLEPLMMALNDRPFAQRVTEARNRAGHAGVRLFRRGSILPGGHGHVYVFQQGGRWEPQMHISCFAGARWGRDALAAGLAFDLREEAESDRSDAGRERIFEYFEGFQKLVSSTWRVHLTDWLRTNGGYVQFGDEPPATDRLPNDAVASLVNADNPAELGRVFVGRWLFMDRGDDIAILTDAPRLLRWLEQSFTDLLPLWGEVYREAYRS
jgi:tetratricopeptide (TPR) repeat protein